MEDEAHSGKPPIFQPEQTAHIITIACQSPKDYNVPYSHWTLSALALTAVQQGIVESISPRTVGRMLNEVELKPHQCKGWLNPKIENPEIYQKQVQAVCDLYMNAIKLSSSGVLLYSTDEMTGIQALEYIHPALPMKPHMVERCEQGLPPTNAIAFLPIPKG